MSSLLKTISVTKLGKTVFANDDSLSILHDISFDIESGESVAIVGASGSGKSTLLSLLAGLDTPTEGEVCLMGQSLNVLDEDGRAKLRSLHTGFVFQSFQLLPHLNALENVMLPAEILGLDLASTRTQAQYWLDKVGLSHRLRHFPKTLSGGEQQRVALARAFISKPAILFADEPTGSLDETSGSRVIELLFELNRECNSTLVLVTHDPALAAQCSRQFQLQAGRLV